MAEVIKTLRSSGGDYSEMSTWEAAEQTDLVAAGDTHVLECYNDWPTGLDNNCNIIGWTTSATNNITIRPAAGQGHGGVPRAGFWMRSNQLNVLYVQAQFTVVEDIEVVGQATGVMNVLRLNRGNASGSLIQRCIAHGENTTSSLQTAFLMDGSGASNSTTVRNNRFVVDGTQGRCARFTHLSGHNLIVQANTAISTNAGNATAVYENANSAVAFGAFDNNVGYAAGSSAVYVACFVGTALNNASSDASAAGTAPVINMPSTAFTNYAGGDYNPAAGQELDGTGADLSGSFTDDITGETRTQWDIGAYGIIVSVSFEGPDIVAQTGDEQVAFSFDENGEGTVASRFTGAVSFAYAPGSDQPPGLTVNPTTGNLEGTPTLGGTYNVTIEGSD